MPCRLPPGSVRLRAHRDWPARPIPWRMPAGSVRLTAHRDWPAPPIPRSQPAPGPRTMPARLTAECRAACLPRTILWTSCPYDGWQPPRLRCAGRIVTASQQPLTGRPTRSPADRPAARTTRSPRYVTPPRRARSQAAAAVLGRLRRPIQQSAQELAERARHYGVPATVQLYPVNAHDFQSLWSFLPEATDALRQAGQFIRDHGEL
jgi:acetyl esterase/lipase